MTLTADNIQVMNNGQLTTVDFNITYDFNPYSAVFTIAGGSLTADGVTYDALEFVRIGLNITAAEICEVP